MDYVNKYLKYKNKYLELKKLIGGGRNTAIDYMKNHIPKQNLGRIKYIVNDIQTFYNSITQDDEVFECYIDKIHNLINNNVDEHIIDKQYQQMLSTLLDDIISKLCDIIYKKYKKIDLEWVYKSYINNTFGVDENEQPKSSFNSSNLEKYVKMRDIDLTLEKDDRFINNKEKSKTGLNGLVEYIETKDIKDKLQKIKDEQEKKEKKKLQQLKLKEGGEEDVIVRLETPNVVIFTPTTEAGSKYYGRNTKWCTAGNKDNLFNHYNKK